jgi:hypothetical protein
LSFSPKFDKIVINDHLETAQAETLTLIKHFLSCEDSVVCRV